MEVITEGRDIAGYFLEFWIGRYEFWRGGYEISVQPLVLLAVC